MATFLGVWIVQGMHCRFPASDYGTLLNEIFFNALFNLHG